MSDHWIALIPSTLHFIPSIDDRQSAVELFRKVAPDADEITAQVSDHVRFFDCGANLEIINCPECGREISIDWWQERMDEDSDGIGFELLSYPAPCCGKGISLDKLKYDWPQGFARFGIEGMNPNIGTMNEPLRLQFEKILGTPLLVIYQQI